MQSEPIQTSSSTALTEQITSATGFTTSKHGLDQEGVGSNLHPAAHADAVASSVSGDETAERAKQRLSNTADTPSTPLHSRIQEYESISSTKRSSDTSTFVVTSTRMAQDISPITNVPNEILTHVLSHLSPNDLAATSVVSRRFHDLVTTPHAWRSAFARYFPGPEALRSGEQDDDPQAVVRTERRAFTRLTSKASWRSEYVIRSRLLRSLARGKPGQFVSTAGSQAARNRVVSPEISYSTEIFGSVNHLHATWSTGLNKRSVKLIHGADDVGSASTSDPLSGRVERWGFSDPFVFAQFAERFPGDAQYGLGPGEIVGVPNVMSVSQTYGMVYGQGYPGGHVYFRSTEEMRGRLLTNSATVAMPQCGVPFITALDKSITAVWIAKSGAIPALTDGLIGILSGSSSGVLTAYSIGAMGPSNNRTTRFTRGEMTARWVLSPGVPIISIAVDNDYTLKRQAENRIWAIVLNALGEVYYLTKFPRRARLDQGQPTDEEFGAWMTGRTVYWTLAETSRRSARPDPYSESSVDGSYSPRSSWNGMCLSQDQIAAETREIEQFAEKKPRDIQKLCYGWDMRRKLEVDFAGNDDPNAGEVVAVFECGLDEGSTAAVTRYVRRRVHDRAGGSLASTPSLTVASTPPSASPSLFGGPRGSLAHPTPFSIDGSVSSLEQDLEGSSTPRPLVEEWQTSKLSFGGMKKVRICTTAIDMSIHALHTRSEDPLLNFADVSAASSPSLGPWSPQDGTASAIDVPGQRARLIAAGTMIGTIFIWNIREAATKSADIISNIEPLRIIYTDSPEIASLALTSLCVVHGGSDGLVQAWDPLASDLQPIRTLNSRFSSRARRQLIQAQASAQGVGINMYAAGAICLDPDPTVLRGVVSLGNRLRFWSYSSSAADQYKSAKRRLRRGERGSNQAADRLGGLQRTNLKDYIANERFELEREKQQRQKDADHIAGRFGTELLDGREEELIAYASMLSQETHAQEVVRRSSDTESATFSSSESVGVWSSDNTATPAGSPPFRETSSKTDEEVDADIAEAIRQSLHSSPSTPSYEVSMRPAKIKARKTPSKVSPTPSPILAGGSRANELNDLDFAIQLSLAEEASRVEHDDAAFTGSEGTSKGKQRQQ